MVTFKLHLKGGLGEFETVMQTREVVEDMHNFREFSQPLECLDEAQALQAQNTWCMRQLVYIKNCMAGKITDRKKNLRK